MYSCMTEEASDPVIDGSEPPAVPGNCIRITTEPSLPSPYVELLRARTSCPSLPTINSICRHLICNKIK